MKFNKLTPITVLVANLFLMGSALAAPSPAPAPGKPIIDSMVSINTNKIRAVKDANGQLIFLTDNGRFAIVGQMFDVKNKKTLRSIEDIAAAVGINIGEDRLAAQLSNRIDAMQGEIQRIEQKREGRAPQAREAARVKPAPEARPEPLPDPANRIDLAAKGFDLAQTNHISIGTGTKHVTIFVDPRCGWCHRVMNEVKDDEELLRKFTLDFVLFAVLGEESRELNERIECAEGVSDEDKFKALVAGADAIRKLPEKAQCSRKLTRGSNKLRRTLNINGVPFIVAPDQRFSPGKPASFRDFVGFEGGERAAPESEPVASAEEQAPKAPVGKKVKGPSDEEVEFDLAAKGFDLSKTNHISIGTGKDHVTIFADPQCGWCHRLMEDIQDTSDDFLKKYTLDIVVVGLLGERSDELAEKLSCAKTTDQMVKFKALAAGASEIEKLEQRSDCNKRAARNSKRAQEKLGIQAVPFIVTSDKRIARGKPLDIEDFVTPRN